MLMAPWLVLVVAIAVAVVWWSKRPDDGDEAALQVLDRRLAEGELDVEEYARRRKALQERGDGSPSGSDRRGGPVAALVAATLVVILLVWLGMASWGGWGSMGGHMGWQDGSTSSTTEVVEGARQVEVEAGELWFDPATVEMTVDEPVNLRLLNTGEAFHDLTVPAADVVLAVDPGEQTVGAIQFAAPGSYEFYCSVRGHAEGGMRGTLVVTESS